MKPVVRPELRLRRLWLIAGLVMAAAIAIGSLTPSSNLPRIGMSDKLQHALAFLVLAFWFGSIVARAGMLRVGIALAVFGALIELSQGLMGWGRSAELADFVADVAGIATGLLLACTPLGNWARWLEARLGTASS